MAVSTEVTDDVAPTGTVNAWWEVAGLGVKVGYLKHNNNVVFMSCQLDLGAELPPASGVQRQSWRTTKQGSGLGGVTVSLLRQQVVKWFVSTSISAT